jgi:lysozyme
MNYKAIAIAGGIFAGIGLLGLLFWTNYTLFIMGISQKGLNLIKQFEGLRLTTYRCSAGVLTIGYGHTGSDVKEGMTITQAQAEELLKNDVKRFEIGVSTLTAGIPLTQNQYDALVSFAYNVGLGAFQSSTLLKKLRENPKDPAISTEFAKWNKAGGAVVAGLTNRRAQESQLYFT